MRVTLALVFLLLPSLALGAVPTVAVNGKLLQPDGLPPASGTIRCSLSQAGSALDGAVSQRVATQTLATVAADGTVTGLALVPNDVITPSGTAYACTFSVRSVAGAPLTWSETWQLASTPNPIAIGAIPRVAPPGATFVAGPTGPAGPTTYDLALSWIGRPIASEVLARIKLAHAFTVPTGCTGSQGAVGTNPTASATVTILKNGASAGTANISTSGVVTWTCASPISLAVGDLVAFQAQATADATLADLSLTLTGAP